MDHGRKRPRGPRKWASDYLFRLGYHRLDQQRYESLPWILNALGWLRFTGEHELRGQLALRQGRPDEAVLALRDAADRFPEIAILNSLLGEAFSNQGAYDSARERFRMVYEAEGANSKALYNLAIVDLRDGRYEEALQWLDRDDREAPESTLENRRRLRVDLLLRLHRSEEALEISALIEEASYRFGVMALVHARNGEIAAAQLALEESFDIRPGERHACAAMREINRSETPVTRKVYGRVLGRTTAEHRFGEGFGAYFGIEIAAEDEEQALSIVRQYEKDLTDVRLEDQEWSDLHASGPPGYLWRVLGHIYYPISKDAKRRSRRNRTIKERF